MNDLISDSQKKFQRVDFEIINIRNELKEMTDKNSTFKSDLMNAIREIKDICRTNSTSINKLSSDISIIKDDLGVRIGTVAAHNDDTLKQVNECNLELNN